MPKSGTCYEKCLMTKLKPEDIAQCYVSPSFLINFFLPSLTQENQGIIFPLAK